MTINNLIVEIDKTYQNEVDGITVNSTIESVAHVTRIATVIDAPSFVSVKKGDKVVCHHNIFVEKNTMKGKRMSDYHIEGKKYFVPFELVFAYIRDGEFCSLSPFCFVKPIEQEDKVVDGFIIDTNDKNSYKGRLSNEGIMVHPNKELLKMGIKRGSRVIYKPYTRYEFSINNEILYKMSTKDIVAKF